MTRGEITTLSYKTAYTMSHSSKHIPKTMQSIMRLLKELDCRFLQFRWSQRGVPHIVLQLGKNTYSICYFRRDDAYKVFYPYPSDSQNRQNCKTPEEVIEFIRGA